MIVLLRMLKARARSAMRVSPCWPSDVVEMPHLLLVTMMRMGSGLAGRLLHTRHEAKSPSAVPASPPVTMVMPSPPWRFWAMAVPGAMEYCTSMGEDTGVMFHSRLEKWPAKLRPPEYGSDAVFFICRSAPMGSSPMASSVPDWR